MSRGKRVRTAAGWRWLTALGMSACLVAGIIVSENAKAQTFDESATKTTQTALARYARDLTRDAEQGRFNSLTDRSNEVERAIEILSRAQKSNPVVLADSQAIRNVVAAGVALRIATGDVPETLQGKRLLKLNLDLLFKDSENGAELVNKLSAILSDAAQSEAKIILLIDPIQALVGSKAAFDGASSALLRDAIRNGDLQCLGASTDIIFQQDVSSDETLASLFVPVGMQEVTDAQAQQSDGAESAKPENSSPEDFVGDKVSSDLRELAESPNAPSHVKAILQVNDTNSAAVRAELAKYGVRVDAQMSRFGALAVDVPTKAIAKLADKQQYKLLIT